MQSAGVQLFVFHFFPENKISLKIIELIPKVFSIPKNEVKVQ